MRKAMNRHRIHVVLGWGAVIFTVSYLAAFDAILGWWKADGPGGVLGLLVGAVLFVAPWFCILILLHYHAETFDSGVAK